MVDIENIHLRFCEFLSLLSVRIRKRKAEAEIKYLEILYNEYDLIQPNYNPVIYDGFGSPVKDDTFSISDRYYRYMIFRRKKIMEGNILLSSILSGIISIVVSALTTWWLLK